MLSLVSLAFALAVAGNEVTEVKVAVAPAQIGRALRGLELRERDADTGKIYFFDLPGLRLFEKGAILRARHRPDKGKDDVTVKLRPLERDRVDPAWLELDGFKCEDDRGGGRSVPACSFSTVPGEHEIRDVARGDRAVRKLFSRKQARFLSELVGWDESWSELRVLGPVAELKWKVELDGFDEALAVELWTIDDTVTMLELSTRAPTREAEAVEAKLLRLLEKLHVQADPEHESKTRRALEYLSRPDGARRAGALPPAYIQ